MEHLGRRPGASPSQIPRPRPRTRPLLPNTEVQAGPVAVRVARESSAGSHISSVSSSSSNRGPTFFGESTEAAISGGQFSNHQGDQVRTNVTITFNSPSNPSADSQGMLTASPQQAFRNPRGVDGIQIPLGSTQTKRKKRTKHVADNLGPVQRSNQLYESHLMLKGRGYPLWIPQPSLRLPIPYRTKGIRVGDVGIITAYGGFDFLFNICRPHNDPINPQELPDGFLPIHPPLNPTDVTEYREFAAGSYVASASVSKVHHDDPAAGLHFESSATGGAVLTMPDGAWHEELGNVSRFKDYIANHAENWYKFVNGPRGREAKNGDVHLVVGCDKATSWGMATFTNRTRAKFQLKFREQLGGQRWVRQGCTYAWEHSGTADVRVGPDDGENDELEAVPGRPLRNQCLFVRTLNVTLADNIWTKLEAELLAARAKGMSDSEFNTQSDFSAHSHFSSGGRSSSTSFNDAQGSQHGPSDELPGASEGSQSGSSPEPVLVADPAPAPYTMHPSKILNNFLLSQKPEATMAITHDQDWYSLLDDQDMEFPDSSTLLERVQLLNDICEDNGIVYLHPKGRDAQIISEERQQIAALGLSLAVGSTSLYTYLFGQDQAPKESPTLRNVIGNLNHCISFPFHPREHRLHSSLPEHPTRLLILDDLFKLLQGEFVYEDMQEESIPFFWHQLNSSATKKQTRIQCLLRLGSALQQRYSRLRLVDDLEEAIHCYTQAASLSGRSHYRHLDAILGLASSIHQRCLLKGQLEDLILLKDTLEREQELGIKMMLMPLQNQLWKMITSTATTALPRKRGAVLKGPGTPARVAMKLPSCPPPPYQKFPTCVPTKTLNIIQQERLQRARSTLRHYYDLPCTDDPSRGEHDRPDAPQLAHAQAWWPPVEGPAIGPATERRRLGDSQEDQQLRMLASMFHGLGEDRGDKKSPRARVLPDVTPPYNDIADDLIVPLPTYRSRSRSWLMTEILDGRD